MTPALEYETRLSIMCTLGLRICFAVFLTAVLSSGANAQDFPNRPITIMVGLAAGGITDVTTRLYAEVVSRNIGQRVTVENKAGAGGQWRPRQFKTHRPMGIFCLYFPGRNMRRLQRCSPLLTNQ